jgi:hypothetical protein
VAVPDTSLLAKKLRELAIISPADLAAVETIVDDVLRHRRKMFLVPEKPPRSGVFKTRAARC